MTKINSRAKGANGEREIAIILKEEYGYDTRRGHQFCGIEGNADLVGFDGLHMEIKRVEKLNLDDAYAQSVRDAKDGEIPVVIHRKNRQHWKVTLSLEDFMLLWRYYEDNRE